MPHIHIGWLTSFYLCITFAFAADRKPNFVYVYADDQRWDALGVVQREQGEKGRFPWLKTPNLDRLAAEGIRFRNAFVVNSLCAPSRASLVTGQYGHINGVTNNHTPHPVDNLSVAALLRPAGYVTGYFGKWHHGTQSGKRPGFDTSASFVGQGKYFDCPIEFDGVAAPSKGFVDDVTTDYATQFIKANQHKPFLMILGLKTCHGPFRPSPRHEKAYEGALARNVPNYGHPAIYAQPDAKRSKGKASDSPEVATNLGMFRGINSVDDNVGKLMKILEELGLTDDTVFIFSSDNGYYLGEHNLGDKRTAYEESLRIPMLLRYPRVVKAGQIDDRMVLNIDPAATFLDLAGEAVPSAMHGHSWKPLLHSKNIPWRDSYFYCYFYERGFNAPLTTAVRTLNAKLIKYPGHDEWTEVFDLQNDPYEIRNLAKDPAYAELRQKLETEYTKQAKIIDFKIPDFADQVNATNNESPKKKARKIKQK